MDAVIYTRVSRDAKGERISVESQERECLAECERRGWTVRKVFCDNNISASRFGKRRPEWEQLQMELRQGDVLVMWEASRAARGMEDHLNLRKVCAEKDVLLSYKGRVLDLADGDDRFTGGLDALLAERESEQTRVRVLRGKLDAARDGKPATRPPWGYRRVGVGEWEFDPVEAPRVREAVERLLAGETQYSVLDWLRATEGYAPSTPTTLRRALLNPAVAGLRQHQGETVGEASWPAMITKEQHDQLKSRDRRMRATYGYSSQPGPQPKYLLSGIAKCGECGEGLRHRARNGRKPYYDCRKGHVSRLVEMLDQAVEAEIFNWLSGIDPSLYETEDVDDSVVLAEIDKVQKRLDDWEAEAIAGKVSAGAFGRAERELTAEMESLRAKLHSSPELELDPAMWPELTIAERRQIVRALFRVVVPKLTRRARALPSDVTITPL
jgi:site-specific DNA recombinase